MKKILKLLLGVCLVGSCDVWASTTPIEDLSFLDVFTESWREEDEGASFTAAMKAYAHAECYKADLNAHIVQCCWTKDPSKTTTTFEEAVKAIRAVILQGGVVLKESLTDGYRNNLCLLGILIFYFGAEREELCAYKEKLREKFVGRDGIRAVDPHVRNRLLLAEGFRRLIAFNMREDNPFFEQVFKAVGPTHQYTQILFNEWKRLSEKTHEMIVPTPQIRGTQEWHLYESYLAYCVRQDRARGIKKSEPSPQGVTSTALFDPPVASV